MDQLTHTVRRSIWINIIQQCQDRPTGTMAKRWLAVNGISEKPYYYQLLNIRRAAREQDELLETSSPFQFSFAEVLIDAALDMNSTQTVPVALPPAVVISSGSLTLKLSNVVLESLLCRRYFILEDATRKTVPLSCDGTESSKYTVREDEDPFPMSQFLQTPLYGVQRFHKKSV